MKPFVSRVRSIALCLFIDGAYSEARGKSRSPFPETEFLVHSFAFYGLHTYQDGETAERRRPCGLFGLSPPRSACHPTVNYGGTICVSSTVAELTAAGP
jgi:hypothetical protein